MFVPLLCRECRGLWLLQLFTVVVARPCSDDVAVAIVQAMWLQVRVKTNLEGCGFPAFTGRCLLLLVPLIPLNDTLLQSHALINMS